MSEVKIERGSGNIFEDIGIDKKEAEELETLARLSVKYNRVLVPVELYEAYQHAYDVYHNSKSV